MVVIFFRVIKTGQEEVARFELVDGKIKVSGQQSYSSLLFGDTALDDLDSVKELMRGAPERYDGAYLRASFQE